MINGVLLIVFAICVCMYPPLREADIMYYETDPVKWEQSEEPMEPDIQSFEGEESLINPEESGMTVSVKQQTRSTLGKNSSEEDIFAELDPVNSTSDIISKLSKKL